MGRDGSVVCQANAIDSRLRDRGDLATTSYLAQLRQNLAAFGYPQEESPLSSHSTSAGDRTGRFWYIHDGHADRARGATDIHNFHNTGLCPALEKQGVCHENMAVTQTVLFCLQRNLAATIFKPVHMHMGTTNPPP